MGDNPAERLKQFRKTVQSNQRDLASALGISPSRVGLIESGGAQPSRAFLERIGFFRLFLMPTFFVGLTVYPRIGLISRSVWELFVPYQTLEKTMASIASVGMRAIGFPATQQGVFITFPEGAVEVGWGCNGLDMAITIAAAGLFMGLLYKQKRSQMIGLISAAIVITLLANIPRLMLVTIAHVYWGPWWFHFWHGFWGGQIFSGVLFTIYYYVVEALVNRSTNQTTNPSHPSDQSLNQ